ncbi:MAG TPA: hypothetical protein VLA19_18975, partial [Herpetosiphonaceae bacterium]|nr:hypothetical protein [Herpetosiphonaceae bacterium]
MAKHVALIVVAVLAMLLASPAALPTSAAGEAALARYMFVSDEYFQMVVELDGRELVTVEVNQLSDYVAIPSDRAHTLVLRARGLGLPDKVVRRITNYRPAVGTSGIEIYRDDGVSVGVADAGPTPAGKSVVNVIWGPTGSAEVRFGHERFRIEPNGGPGITRVVDPQTAPLELRAPDGRLIDRQFLRAQPDYRYDVVVAQPNENVEAARLVVKRVSPQLQARPTPTQV